MKENEGRMKEKWSWMKRRGELQILMSNGKEEEQKKKVNPSRHE